MFKFELFPCLYQKSSIIHHHPSIQFMFELPQALSISETVKKKSRIRETPTLSTDADSRTNTNLKRLVYLFIFFSRGGVKNKIPDPFFF